MPTDKPSRRLTARGKPRLPSLVARRAPEPTRRRASDRHYLAVVAAEARRLASQLRPPTRTGDGSRGRTLGRGPIRGEAGAEVFS
jgi:hypothetical protein